MGIHARFFDAIKRNDQIVVAALLQNPELNLDTRDQFGKSALLLAAEVSSTTILSLILDHILIHRKDLLSCTDNNGANLLNYTIAGNNLENLKLLFELKLVGDTLENLSNILNSVVIHGSIEVIQYIESFIYTRYNIKLNQLLNKDGFQLIASAIQSDNLSIIKFLIDYTDQLTPDCKGFTPLHYATMGGSAMSLKLILDCLSTVDGFNLNNIKCRDGMNLVQLALSSENFSVITFLLNNGVSILKDDDYGNSTLHYASQYGDFHILHLILTVYEYQGVFNINNIKNHAGETPLHAALAGVDKQDNVQLLINKGADLFYQDRNGWSSFHFAARYSNLMIFKLLFNSIPPINLHSELFFSLNGENIMDCAVRNNHQDVIAFISQITRLPGPDLPSYYNNNLTKWANYLLKNNIPIGESPIDSSSHSFQRVWLEYMKKRKIAIISSEENLIKLS